MSYYIIKDDCGWMYAVQADDGICPMLAPHTRGAIRITKETYDAYHIKRRDLCSASEGEAAT